MSPEPQSTVPVEPLTAERIAWLRRVASAALNTWVGRNWPSMEAMRRDGIGHGLVEKSGRPDQAIRRYLDTFQPDLVVDLLDRIAARPSPAEPRTMRDYFKSVVPEAFGDEDAEPPVAAIDPERPRLPDRLANRGFVKDGDDLETVLSAVDHLLGDHDCDLIGYEGVMAARDRLREASA